MHLHRRTPRGSLETSEFDLAPASEFMAGGRGLYGPAVPPTGPALQFYYWIDVASGIAAALFTQVLPFFDSWTVELALAVERLVYQSYTA